MNAFKKIGLTILGILSVVGAIALLFLGKKSTQKQQTINDEKLNNDIKQPKEDIIQADVQIKNEQNNLDKLKQEELALKRKEYIAKTTVKVEIKTDDDIMNALSDIKKK